MRQTVYDCSIIELPKIENRAGNITPVQGNINVPFEVKRVFYLYDIPGGEARGAHAHKECHQFLVAAHGSFEVVLDDGINKRTVLLNRPFYGLHIPPGVWAAEQGFSSGAICLVLTSHVYDESDYIRNYDEFLAIKKGPDKLSPNFVLDKYGLHIRLVEAQDADFILKLRTDPRLGRFLNTTKPDKKAQISWIKEYKKREQAGLDYYFIFEKPVGVPLGVCRIYDIKDTEFTIGSWLFSPDAPVGSAILADIITREIAFGFMPQKKLKFDVKCGNVNVLRYQYTYKPTVIQEDVEDILFELSKENFEKYKKLHLRMFAPKQ